jgi:amino acid transporter
MGARAEHPAVNVRATRARSGRAATDDTRRDKKETAHSRVTILVRVAPADYPAAVLSPAASPNGQFTEITDAMIYGITAFAGFEAATALGEEARNTRRSVPASTIGVVIVTGIFYLLVVHAEMFGVGRPGIPGFVWQDNPLGYLTGRYWSPSAVWVIELVVVPAGLGFVIATFNVAIRVLFAMGREQVLPGTLARLSRRRTPTVSIACVAAFALVLGLPLTYRYGGARTFGHIAGAGGLAVILVYLAVNIAVIRAFRTEFRDEFSLWRHLIVPAAAVVLFLFLCVPKTSSTSCDQAVFVDQSTGLGLSSDAAPVEIDRFG